MSRYEKYNNQDYNVTKNDWVIVLNDKRFQANEIFFSLLKDLATKYPKGVFGNEHYQEKYKPSKGNYNILLFNSIKLIEKILDKKIDLSRDDKDSMRTWNFFFTTSDKKNNEPENKKDNKFIWILREEIVLAFKTIVHQENEKFDLYNKYYVDKNYELIWLWSLLESKFKIKNVLYPGSYVQVSPSKVFDNVTYIDSDKKAIKFFKAIETKELFGNKYLFIGKDYNNDLKLNVQYDLIISLYAGFVKDNNIKYLKKGGIIIANNSHNDAINMRINTEVKLIGVILDKKIISTNLDKYLIVKDNNKLNEFKDKKHMKTLEMEVEAKYYIFKI